MPYGKEEIVTDTLVFIKDPKIKLKSWMPVIPHTKFVPYMDGEQKRPTLQKQPFPESKKNMLIDKILDSFQNKKITKEQMEYAIKQITTPEESKVILNRLQVL